jgi:hypothetical protein
MNTNEFNRNLNLHTPEELAPFEDRYVAWSEDGKAILAHAATEAELYEEIDRRQLKSYVVGYIPRGDCSYY